MTTSLVAPGPAAVSAVTRNPYSWPATRFRTVKDGVDEYVLEVAVVKSPLPPWRYSTR
ncbi:unannotated protein [freshwater metagenome]|uniref:Unannotated protein n=1 Tax=freshwater metagenome TaxID=449393 RepID=A0A6J6EDZ5_9ZZZZ